MRMYRQRRCRTISTISRHRLLPFVLAAAALALAATSFATASTHAGHAVPNSAALGAIRSDVQQWLTSAGFKGFRVSEVMAFANNDYVAVDGVDGKPAFELLTSSSTNWVMEEPASMMWNTKYGMLRGSATTIEPIPGMSMMWAG